MIEAGSVREDTLRRSLRNGAQPQWTVNPSLDFPFTTLSNFGQKSETTDYSSSLASPMIATALKMR